MTIRVGFICLGRMGLQMCYRLLQAGFDLTVHGEQSFMLNRNAPVMLDRDFEAVRQGLGDKDGAAIVLPLEANAGFQIRRRPQ